MAASLRYLDTPFGSDGLVGQSGFGDNEASVKMMNLMMVEGSGMEGMDMSGSSKTVQLAENEAKIAPQHTAPPSFMNLAAGFEIGATPSAPPKMGANSISFAISNSITKEAVKGIKVKARVFMTSMDMGTEEPAVQESKPGVYTVNANFSMKGPWSVKLLFVDGSEKTFKFDAR